MYEPRELAFGTSGRRGRVVDLTQLEIYINVTAELNFLLSLPRAEGGIEQGERFYYAHDLRPSSNGICCAVERAIGSAGLTPVNMGAIPTPALAYFALAEARGSIMVTGSHIPFDLNGYKLNTSAGELRKDQEAPIGEEVRGFVSACIPSLSKSRCSTSEACFAPVHATCSPPTNQRAQHT